MAKTIESKGTRLGFAKVIAWITTIGWFVSSVAVLAGFASVEDIKVTGVTFENWMNTMTLVLGIYAISETGVKAAEGYMNR